MIKFGIRRNLFYAMMFVIFNLLRKFDSIIMINNFEFYGSFILTISMFFADFISGLIVYLYHLKYLKEKETTKFMGIELIKAPSNIQPPDGCFKIYSLLFLASYLDFSEYLLSSYYIPDNFKDLSCSLEWRLKCIIICASAFFCYTTLNFPIFKHQIVTLIIILTCLIIIIGTEIIAYSSNYEVYYILKVLFLMLIDHIFNSFLDVIEKYLLEYDFLNPFKILMLEGIMGLILSFFFTLSQKYPFKNIKAIYNEKPDDFRYLLIFIILYFLLSCGRNIYRVTTNKLYSPTHKALFDYILVPILIIYYYIFSQDFQIKDKQIFYYFIINLIISFIIVIAGLIYNELIIIFICGMEYNTHYEVSKRAKEIETHAFELSGSENESQLSSFYNED